METKFFVQKRHFLQRTGLDLHQVLIQMCSCNARQSASVNNYVPLRFVIYHNNIPGNMLITYKSRTNISHEAV